MKKKEGLKSNLFYSFINEIVVVLIPLITTPYVSRILHEDGIGQYSFSYSIVYFFVLLATFGFGQYSRREIANCKDDKYECSKKFWEIFIARSITSIISFCILFIIIFSNVLHEYNILLLIISSLVIDTIFNISFYFQGMEEFKSLSIRNSLVKIMGMILIFIFVKNETHTWIYAMCLCFPTLIGNLLMWPSLRKRIVSVKIKQLNITKHIIPALKLFIPSIAISLYTLIDKTLIGFLSENSDYENGCYEQAYKIISMMITVVTIIGPIMLSRNSAAYKNNEKEKIEKNIDFSIKYVSLVSIPLIVGTLVLSKNISTWLFGEGYDIVPQIMNILVFMILFMGISNTIGVQFFIPTKKDSYYSFCIIIGLIINISINTIMIPLYGSIGAAVGTLISEFIIMMLNICLFIKSKYIKVPIFNSSFIKYSISGIISFIIGFFLQKYIFDYSILSFLLLGSVIVALYFVIIVILRDNFILELIKNTKNWIFKKRTNKSI